MEAIILAGGLGRRLQPITLDVIPKTLVEIHGKPVLEWILSSLSELGIEHTVIAVGHKGEMIEKRIGPLYEKMTLAYAKEAVPLGTGGAVKNASRYLKRRGNFFVANGDTYWTFDTRALIRSHRDARLATLGVTHVNDPTYYGWVELGEGGTVSRFINRSESRTSGHISTGLYVFSERALDFMPDGSYWLEENLLPQFARYGKLGAHIFGGGSLYPIDTPVKYEAALRAWPIPRR